jgi:hypothetical protein
METKTKPRTSSGDKIAARWDGMTYIERLNLIMAHADLFSDPEEPDRWLITQSEIDMVNEMHESAREYIVEREDQPLFTSINLKKTVAAQHHREKLQAALEAVFK